MIEILKFTDTDSTEAQSAFEIRSKVFVEEQKVSREEEFDEYEKSSTHYLALSDGLPCAAARWRSTQNGIKLERFAVLKQYRGLGIGENILLAVLKDAMPLGKKIYLHAQISAEGFYLKNNFIAEGEHFWEANIEHVKMVYNKQLNELK